MALDSYDLRPIIPTSNFGLSSEIYRLGIEVVYRMCSEMGGSMNNGVRKTFYTQSLLIREESQGSTA